MVVFFFVVVCRLYLVWYSVCGTEIPEIYVSLWLWPSSFAVLSIEVLNGHVLLLSKPQITSQIMYVFNSNIQLIALFSFCLKVSPLSSHPPPRLPFVNEFQFIYANYNEIVEITRFHLNKQQSILFIQQRLLFRSKSFELRTFYSKWGWKWTKLAFNNSSSLSNGRKLIHSSNYCLLCKQNEISGKISSQFFYNLLPISKRWERDFFSTKKTIIIS